MSQSLVLAIVVMLTIEILGIEAAGRRVSRRHEKLDRGGETPSGESNSLVLPAPCQPEQLRDGGDGSAYSDECDERTAGRETEHDSRGKWKDSSQSAQL